MEIKFFNTLGRSKQTFAPIGDVVTIYCCGPTVYHFAHIGNFRSYLFEDVLVRFLRFVGFPVKHVMNITDVGHLVSDSDEGEDKMIIAARKENKDVFEIAEFYTKVFFDDSKKLNIRKPDVVCKATDHILDMITLIKKLEAKGLTYISGGNVYYDTSKFKDYNKLRGNSSLEKVARVESDSNKRNPEDFVLWFTKSKYENHILLWDSPWGRGYPGWHIECSAMAMRHLGETIDIHCGGCDHIPIHHTNEIAQSEGATGKQFARFWLHNEFVLFNNDKMSKSKGSIVTVSDLENEGFDALDYRYLTLTAHYRTQLNFTFDALSSARSARKALILGLAKFVAEHKVDLDQLPKITGNDLVNPLADDLNTPQTLANIWLLLERLNRENLSKIIEVDEILGLKLRESIRKALEIDPAVLQLAQERALKRKEGMFSYADNLREKIKTLGYQIFDLRDEKYIILNENF